MAQAIFDGKIWRDSATKQPLSAEQSARAQAAWTSRLATIPDEPATPSEMADKFSPSTLGQNLQRNLPPLGLQTGGEEAGALAGTALGGPLGGIAGAAIGGGLGNIGAKFLPERFGGSPEQSNLKAFAWGAVPSGIGRGIGAGMLARNQSTMAKRFAEHIKDFDKLSEENAGHFAKRFGEQLTNPKITSQAVNQVHQFAGGASPFSPYPNDPLGRMETLSTRNALIGPVDRMRTQFGGPIGQAYQALKGDQHISEQEAIDIADAAQGVEDSLISPAPKAKAILQKLKSFAPPMPEQMPPSAQLMSPQDQQKALQKIQSTHEKALADYQTPTLDDLRQVRQWTNEQLRSSQGGSAHALKELQQALDQHMMPYLPPGMDAMRGQYAQFITNYPWKSMRQLRQTGAALDMSDWLFDTHNSQARELINRANPQEKRIYQRLYSQRLFKDLDPNATPEEQMTHLASQTKKDSGIIQELYGPRKQKVLNDLIQMPHRAKVASQIWKREDTQRAWTSTFMDTARKVSRADAQAAEDGFATLVASMSPEDRSRFMQGIQGTYVAPQGIVEGGELLDPKGAYKQKLLSNAEGPNEIPRHIKSWVIPFALGSMMMGQHFGIVYGAGAGSIAGAKLATKAGWKWAAQHGVADIVSNSMDALAHGKYNKSAQLMFSALAIAGGRVAHEKVRNSNADDQ